MISESDWVPTDGLELEPEALLAVKETRKHFSRSRAWLR